MAEKKARKIKAKAAKRAKLDPDKSQTALDLQKQGTQDDISDSESSEEDEEDDTEPDLQNRGDYSQPPSLRRCIGFYCKLDVTSTAPHLHKVAVPLRHHKCEHSLESCMLISSYSCL